MGEQGSLLLRGARALLGTAFSLSEPLDVEIEGGRIRAIGPAGSLPEAPRRVPSVTVNACA
jgi:hypothetical protein